MKFIFSVCLIVTSVAVLSFATELSLDNQEFERSKRAVALEYCPDKSTPAECKEYAKEISKTMNYCHNFVINKNTIQWQSCGIVSCEGLKVIPEDLSKPYPNCCQTCKV